MKPAQEQRTAATSIFTLAVHSRTREVWNLQVWNQWKLNIVNDLYKANYYLSRSSYIFTPLKASNIK